MIELIDVSQFNGRIDYAKVAAAVDGAYVRATVGLDTEDEKLLEHANGFRSVGLPFGLYGLLYPRTGPLQDADAQARQLWELHQETGASLIPASDLEDGPPGPPTDIQWARAFAAWRDRMWMCLQRPPAAYCSPSFAMERPTLLYELQRAPCVWWAASYTDTMPPALGNLKPTMWQYRGGGNELPERFRGRCDGVEGDVDRTRILDPSGLDVLRAI